MPFDLHHRALVADTHNDLLMAVAARPPQRWAGFFRDRWLPQLREGGVKLQVLPVFIDTTHSSARALRDHHRNLTDDQLRGVAATGGVVCVNFVPEFLADDPADHTLDRLVDHIAVAGVDHVGLGPDFVREVIVTPPLPEESGFSLPSAEGNDGQALTVSSKKAVTGKRFPRRVNPAVPSLEMMDTTPPCCEELGYGEIDPLATLPGLDGPRGLPLVTEALTRRGMPEKDILKILGGNVHRLLGEALR
ncbi:membrane dipeptidase [Streptosporangium sp. NPDC000396]|uniref:membrane dipeptidase n=1 Tax=Streptosporangium sp. NPDC000396 TaxID=3366185 RepID=UPI0036CFB20E